MVIGIPMTEQSHSNLRIRGGKFLAKEKKRFIHKESFSHHIHTYWTVKVTGKRRKKEKGRRCERCCEMRRVKSVG